MAELNHTNRFDVAAARRRCLVYRRRILDLSQGVSALHIAPAFSCLEAVDCIYNGLMREGIEGSLPDTFLMSKGHGCLAQYVVLESLGILPSDELGRFCRPQGRYGAHPDYGLPGIEASTGSLGHGMGLAVGMAYADKIKKDARLVHVLLSDGELQEGSTWEAIMMAANLKLRNLIAFIDLNDFQSLGRTSESHPHFYPVSEKVLSFGWECREVNGHDASAIFDAAFGYDGNAPLMVVCHTIKGRGVSYMENQPIWHYRSPSPQEYQKALDELAEVAS